MDDEKQSFLKAVMSQRIINNNEFLNRMALQYMRTVIKGVL